MFANVTGGHGFSRGAILALSPNLIGRLVLWQSDVDRVSQCVVGFRLQVDHRNRERRGREGPLRRWRRRQEARSDRPR
jgi:hypothetical protein